MDLYYRYREEMESNPDKWFREASFNHWMKAIGVIAEFFHCDSHDLVLVSNATTGIVILMLNGACVVMLRCFKWHYGFDYLTVKHCQCSFAWLGAHHSHEM